MYRVFVINPCDGRVVLIEDYAYFDDPELVVDKFFENRVYLIFRVNVSDLSGISSVLLECGNRNYTFTPLEIDEKGNGLYF